MQAISELPQLRIKDPEMKETFWSTVESLESLSSMGRLNQWKTRKELEDRYGKEELEVLIADNSFLVRANPLNPKLKLYLDRTDSLTTSLNKSSKWSAGGTTKTDKNQHLSLMEAFTAAELDEDMLEKVHLGMYEDAPIEDLVDNDDDNSRIASLPPALKRRLAANKAREGRALEARALEARALEEARGLVARALEAQPPTLKRRMTCCSSCWMISWLMWR